MEEKVIQIQLAEDCLNQVFVGSLLDRPWKVQEGSKKFLVSDARNFVQENLKRGSQVEMVCPSCQKPIQSPIRAGETLHEYTERLRKSREGLSKAIKRSLKGGKGRVITFFHRECIEEKRANQLSLLLYKAVQASSLESLRKELEEEMPTALELINRFKIEEKKGVEHFISKKLEKIIGYEWPRQIQQRLLKYDYLNEKWFMCFQGKEIEFSVPVAKH